MILPVLPAIAGSFSLPLTTLSWAVTGYAFAAAVLNLFAASFSDRLGRKPLLLVGLFGFSASSFALAYSASFAAFFILRATTGLCAGLLSTSVMAYVGDYFPYANRGRAMGTVMASYFAALVFGVPLGAWVADHWGWPYIFLTTASLGLLLGVAVAWRLPSLGREAEEGIGPSGESVGSAGRYGRFLGSGPLLAMLLSSACVSGATLALLTFVSPWLLQRFAVSTSTLGLIFMVIGGASALASPLSGWLADRVGKRQAFVGSSLVTAVLLLSLPFSPGLRLLMLLLFGMGLAMALRQTSQQTLATEMVSKGRGSFVALRNAFSQGGIGLSVLVAAPLFGAFGFASVAAFSAALSLAAALLFYWVPEPGATRGPTQSGR